jgi:hypothetical protein
MNIIYSIRTKNTMIITNLSNIIFYSGIFFRICYLYICVMHLYYISDWVMYQDLYLGRLVLSINIIVILLSVIYRHNQRLTWIANFLTLIGLRLIIIDCDLFSKMFEISNLVQSSRIGFFSLYLEFSQMRQLYKKYMFDTVINAMLNSKSDTISVKFFFRHYIISTPPVKDVDKFKKFFRTVCNKMQFEINQSLNNRNFGEIPVYAMFIYNKILVEYNKENDEVWLPSFWDFINFLYNPPALVKYLLLFIYLLQKKDREH